ncbi:uncharacterized protein slow [Drosophila tropicalis]|uniref:uncharacterized protein slow n=1 Tax=Drosophila tropicalis TaxID=46794 RepID=UPI0035AB73B0
MKMTHKNLQFSYMLLLLLLLTEVLGGQASSSSRNSSSSSNSNTNSSTNSNARTHGHGRGHGHRQRHHASAPHSRKMVQHNAKADAELLPGVTMPPPRSTEVTRLRRLHPQGSYNKGVVTHRLHHQGARPNEWDYNTYNVYTNTYGPPPPPVPSTSSTQAGKGEDNTQDVEFIGVHSRGRGYDYYPAGTTTTTAPPPNLNRRSASPGLGGMGTVPPLVPARRGYSYTTTAPTSVTEDPYETNTIGRNYPTDPKEMERRHICVQQRTITMPVKTTEVYTRPTWKHVSTPCQPPTHAGQMCTRVQLVHEQAYRDVIKHKPAQQMTYDCCTGWTRETPRADACMKPVCAARCQNGGNYTNPQTCACSCPAGYTGRYCESDVNECHVDKPCDQQCVNTQGSYFCRCRHGFVLQADQQSCRKASAHADDAFEARDLENDIDDNDVEVATRLQKIERSLANERVHTNELQKSLQATYSMVDTLKSRLSTLEKQAMDVNRLQTNLYKTESRTNKLEGMLNLLLKCRNGPNANCP